MTEMLGQLASNSELLLQGLQETLYMVLVSMMIAVFFGIPLGVGVVVTEPNGILEKKEINFILGSIINVARSIPFIILMVAIIPFTRLIVGTSIGTTAAIVPLAVAAIPFIGRIVENSLKEVDPGVVEAAQAMGATPWEIITKVLIPEALPSLILGITLALISLIGYSAIVGAVGGGGLGDIAIRYGYQRFQGDVMLQTVVILVVLVQLIQSIGNWLSSKLNKAT
ncbi:MULTISPECIES: methionine ABC transporter permease [unclassified Candidatus Frackibacter]|uniref:methionine ABC transporter permease n=1 Tax=unclassified Candidatus Frackibacter TaxID=2648818 RepID=UPI00088A8656|nr:MULTISPECIES: methionine ABC transporter permease [unclassified Candidatus Frackibacter]SDC24297.1 D-methionine transport system permease protein [Candidatus Frackibacter sp. WG11]SEM47733.1 D-methionine transport system permease protein [Candidatus Frackibacter sp. WG12]SFL49769.1 D-methionine transport system permease protein [Candidatus Frackibacter sp. WG13]